VADTDVEIWQTLGREIRTDWDDRFLVPTPSPLCADVGVAFEEDELWAFLAAAHTGILTTLRADGWPLALPVVRMSRPHVYVRTPARTRKVAHVRRRPGGCASPSKRDCRGPSSAPWC